VTHNPSFKVSIMANI